MNLLQILGVGGGKIPNLSLLSKLVLVHIIILRCGGHLLVVCNVECVHFANSPDECNTVLHCRAVSTTTMAAW